MKFIWTVDLIAGNTNCITGEDSEGQSCCCLQACLFLSFFLSLYVCEFDPFTLIYISQQPSPFDLFQTANFQLT